MVMKGLNELRDEALRIATEHGFTDQSVGETLMLMVTEVAEAMEDHRAGHSPTKTWYEIRGRRFAMKDPPPKDNPGIEAGDRAKPCGIPSEMADIVILVMHFCGKHGIDIEKAVEEKMVYNESRPFMHGKVI